MYGKSKEYYSYNTVFFISTLLEKLLRELHCKLHEDGFFQNDNITLGGLFKSIELEEILGKDTLRWLNYYFLKEEKGIGIDYRNRIGHYKNVKIGDVKEIDVIKILWLYVMTINSLVIKSTEDSRLASQ